MLKYLGTQRAPKKSHTGIKRKVVKKQILRVLVLRRIALVKGLVLYAKHKMLESDEKLSLI